MKLLSKEELENRIEEIENWVHEEVEIWAKENLLTNLRHFRRLLEYYNKGFEEGQKFRYDFSESTELTDSQGEGQDGK